MVVALIIGSASLAFYSIMYSVLTSQQSKYLLNSSNDFLLAYKETFQNTENDFANLTHTDLYNLISNQRIISPNIDFILERGSKESNVYKRFVAKDGVNLPQREATLEEFININPSALIRSHTFPDGYSVYYGRLLTDEFLNSIAQKIDAQVAIITGNSALQISNQYSNQKYIYYLNKAYKNLSHKESFHIYSEDSDQAGIISTLCRISTNLNENQELRFLIFSTLNEAAALKSNIIYFLVTIGISGIVLSVILTFVFTQNMRRQLSLLGDATEQTKRGDFKNRISIKSRDEIGQLASAFNSMLDELDKNDRAITDYSEFLTLINRNATLKEIADAALNKIIKTCGFAIGAIYAVNKESISLIRSIGIKAKSGEASYEFLDSAIKNREILELSFDKNFPLVSSGIISLEIKHMLVIPIIYNNDVIAVIELGGLDKPSKEVKAYLSKIQEQLAIGLTNAFAFVQLENLVVELRLLNEEYQKKNKQIKLQNDSLLELHNQLKIKAAELEVQKIKAEESTKLKSQFLASMSHELRTPMNSVLGLTELILDEGDLLTPKLKERLEIVHRSGKRLMSLLNDILDLSKIESGKMELKNDEILLEDIITDVEASIKPLIAKKHLELIITRNINTNVSINIDKDKVTQVLINLLGNAIKFTERGAVELRINDSNEKLQFAVIDSGIGISTEHQKIIFEEFRQIDGSNTRKYGGTGLGLSICKKIAEMLNGSLTVESEVNKGSIFTFIVPFMFTDPLIKDQSLVFNTEAMHKRDNTILFIENDENVRLKIGNHLISWGYNIKYSKDETSTVTVAENLQPHAIIVDLSSCNPDIWTILHMLRTNPATYDLPLILISLSKDQNLGYGVGVHDFIVEPFLSSKLDLVLKKLINSRVKETSKIVFVENEEDLENYQTTLATENRTIDIIRSSSKVVENILNSKPDVVFINLLINDINGIALIHELKNRRESRQIPIIIYTNKFLDTNEKSALQDHIREITDKAQNHPMDVVKFVRDRLRSLESSNFLSILHKDNRSLSLTSKNPELKPAEPFGHVLVVDDDPDALFTINEIVQSCNCTTTVAKNGRECLELLKENIPDLILLDIMMPEMDGFQTIKKIKENSLFSQIPVFAVTARAMLEDKQIILKNGFDDYISKPVNTGVISFKIEKLFSKLKTI